jgi:cell division protein FtsZ
MSGAGSALMGIGSARGDNRALLAAEQAIASPLLEASMEGAHGVLLSISGGSDLGLFEINEAASLVSDAAHPDANIIFGAVIDDALGDEVRVTVIAAGFDGGRPNARKDAGMAFTAGGGTSTAGAAGVAGLSQGFGGRTPATAPGGSPAAQPAPVGTGERLAAMPSRPAAPAPAAQPATPPAAPAPSPSARPAAPAGGPITVPPLPPITPQGSARRPLTSEDFEEELDIPEFLRST